MASQKNITPKNRESTNVNTQYTALFEQVRQCQDCRPCFCGVRFVPERQSPVPSLTHRKSQVGKSRLFLFGFGSFLLVQN